MGLSRFTLDNMPRCFSSDFYTRVGGGLGRHSHTFDAMRVAD